MSYRAIFTADVHAGNNLPWSVKDPESQISDRLGDVIDALDQMSVYAMENDITDIWFVGDLLDRRLVDAATLKTTTQQLRKMQQRGQHLYIVPGNHEAGDAACRHYTVDAYHQMDIVVAGQQGQPHQVGILEPVDGFIIAAMPYLPPERANIVLEWIEEHPFNDGINLLLIHQTIKGGKIGEWPAPEGLDPEWLRMLAPTYSGHFHQPQSINDSVHYLGAPIQHSFSDVGDERGFWDLTFHGKEITSKKIPIMGAPTFHELRWITSGHPPDVSAINVKDYINLRVVGPSASVDKLWKTVEQWCAETKVQTGARLIKPIKAAVVDQARRRIALADPSGERPSMDKLLSAYIEQADCTGLNRNKLEQLGKELMADAEG